MAIVSLNNIKSWFKTGKKPTEQQFSDTFDSFYHKADMLSTNDVNGLNNILNNKLDSSQFDGHTADKNNPHEVTAEQVGLGDVHEQLAGKLEKGYDDGYARVVMNGELVDPADIVIEPKLFELERVTSTPQIIPLLVDFSTLRDMLWLVVSGEESDGVSYERETELWWQNADTFHVFDRLGNASFQFYIRSDNTVEINSALSEEIENFKVVLKDSPSDSGQTFVQKKSFAADDLGSSAGKILVLDADNEFKTISTSRLTPLDEDEMNAKYVSTADVDQNVSGTKAFGRLTQQQDSIYHTSYGTPSLWEAAMISIAEPNQLAFYPIDKLSITASYDTEGEDWTAPVAKNTDAEKKKLVGGDENAAISVKTVQTGELPVRRVKVELLAHKYCWLNDLVVIGNNGRQTHKLKVEALNGNTGAWEAILTDDTPSKASEFLAHISHPTIMLDPSGGAVNKHPGIRLIFYDFESLPSVGEINSFTLWKLMWFGVYPAIVAKESTVDGDKNITFQGKLTAAAGYMPTADLDVATKSYVDGAGGGASHQHGNLPALELIDKDINGKPTWEGRQWPRGEVPTLNEIAQKGDTAYRPIAFEPGSYGNYGVTYDQIFGNNDCLVQVLEKRPILDPEESFPLELRAPLAAKWVQPGGEIYIRDKETQEDFFFPLESPICTYDDVSLSYEILIVGELPTGEADLSIGNVIMSKLDGTGELRLTFDPEFYEKYTIEIAYYDIYLGSQDEKILSLKSFKKPSIDHTSPLYSGSKAIVQDKEGNLKTLLVEDIIKPKAGTQSIHSNAYILSSDTNGAIYALSGDILTFSLDRTLFAPDFTNRDQQLYFSGFKYKGTDKISQYFPVVTENIPYSEGSKGIVGEIRAGTSYMYFWEIMDNGTLQPLSTNVITSGARIRISGSYIV